MPINTAALARPVGPLPLWGWGALAAGIGILLLARRGVPAAAAVVDPNAAVPAPPDATAQAPAAALQAPIALPPGTTAYDPNTGTQTTPVSVSDLLGGTTLSQFIGNLGPDYTNFNFTAGDLSTTVAHRAASDVQTQQYEDAINANLASNAQVDAQALAQYNAANQFYLDSQAEAHRANQAAQDSTYAYNYAMSHPGNVAVRPDGVQYTYGAV